MMLCDRTRESDIFRFGTGLATSMMALRFVAAGVTMSHGHERQCGR